jgi:dTDP-4-amino-4,6-dideoxygalactose transaminase
MRMMEMQAVIGRIQLKRMPEWTARRQANAKAIDTVADEFDLVRSVEVPSHLEHGYYKHYLFVNPENLAGNWTRDLIVEEVTKLGVPCYQGSCSEVYLEKAFDATGWRPETRLPNARELGETSLMFLVHPTLPDSEIEKTCAVLKQVLAAAER